MPISYQSLNMHRYSKNNDKWGALFTLAFVLRYLAGLVSLAFALPHIVSPSEAEKYLSIGVYAFLIYTHCCVWLLVFVFDLIFSAHHRFVCVTLFYTQEV